MDNFKIAKAMKTIKKECESGKGQCNMMCCLFSKEKAECKFRNTELGEPRDWQIDVDVSCLYTNPFVDEDGVIQE